MKEQLKELKSIAYDILAQIEAYQGRLKEVNGEIYRITMEIKDEEAKEPQTSESSTEESTETAPVETAATE